MLQVSSRCLQMCPDVSRCLQMCMQLTASPCSFASQLSREWPAHFFFVDWGAEATCRDGAPSHLFYCSLADDEAAGAQHKSSKAAIQRQLCDGADEGCIIAGLKAGGIHRLVATLECRRQLELCQLLQACDMTQCLGHALLEQSL